MIFMVSVNQDGLIVMVSSPITKKTIFLSPVTAGNAISPHQIELTVCGNEVISLKEDAPVLV